MILALRSTIVLSYFFLIAFLGILICLFRPFNPDNTRICGRLFAIGANRLLGIKVEIEGKEHLANMTPRVVIANHQSNLDLFICGAVVPYRTVSLGKKSLKYIPFFGQVYWLAGNIMIDRSKRRESINVLSQTTEALTEKNTSIWIFPEGTRNQGKNILPFKIGAFHMAAQAGVPIQPICVSTYPNNISLNSWRAGTVRIRILAPIPTSGFDPADKQALRAFMQEVHEAMLSNVEALDRSLS